MKKIIAASALAIAALSVSPLLSAPAIAQAKSVALADVRVAASRSNAFTVASQQIQTTYKAQIDQQETRGQTLQAELNVLVAKYNEEAKKTPQIRLRSKPLPRPCRTSASRLPPSLTRSANLSTSRSPMLRIRSAFA